MDRGAGGGAMEILTETRCLELLQSAEIGRVGVTIGALPAIFPVNFRFVDGAVMFLTGSGTKFTAALSESVVAFETDEVDLARRSGWSVQVTGVARLSDDSADRAAADRAGLSPWAPGDRPYLVTIVPHLVSGRRLLPPLEAPAG